MHVQTCANFQFYQHMNGHMDLKTVEKTKWNETEKEKAEYGQKKFYGKWKIEALQVDEAYQTKVLVVNNISCTYSRCFFFLFSSCSVLFCRECVVCVLCYVMLCYAIVCSNFTGCVIFNYVWKSIFQWAYRTHSHTCCLLCHCAFRQRCAVIRQNKCVFHMNQIK